MSIFHRLPGSGGAETELAEVTAVAVLPDSDYSPDFVRGHALLLLDLLLGNAEDFGRP